MKPNCAIYQISETITFSDVELIGKSVRTFGFANIIIDRNDIPISGRRYRMSYQDRADVVRNEMNRVRITDYRILPSDVSFQSTVKENGITEIMMDFSSERCEHFRTMRKIEEFTGIKPILVKTMDCNCYEVANDMFEQDSSMKMHRKYCTDYSFSMFKLKNTRKIGIISDGNKVHDRIVRDCISERGYDVIDMDSKRGKDVYGGMAQAILGSFDKTQFVKYGGIKKDGMTGLFNGIITQDDCDDILGTNGDVAQNEMVIRGKNDIEFKNNLICALNKKIKLNQLCK